MSARTAVKAKITSKGQVTIPKDVRRRLGLRVGDDIEFIEDRHGFRVRKRMPGSVFAKYRGRLTKLAGCDPDYIVEQMRGR